MKTKYKGYNISVERDVSMMGMENIYFYVIRESDGLVVEDSFTDGTEKIPDVMRYMKGRVDQFIHTKGKSEGLGKKYGEG